MLSSSMEILCYISYNSLFFTVLFSNSKIVVVCINNSFVKFLNSTSIINLVSASSLIVLSSNNLFNPSFQFILSVFDAFYLFLNSSKDDLAILFLSFNIIINSLSHSNNLFILLMTS